MLNILKHQDLQAVKEIAITYSLPFREDADLLTITYPQTNHVLICRTIQDFINWLTRELTFLGKDTTKNMKSKAARELKTAQELTDPLTQYTINYIALVAEFYGFIIIEKRLGYITLEEPGTGNQHTCYTMNDFMNWSKELFL